MVILYKKTIMPSSARFHLNDYKTLLENKHNYDAVGYKIILIVNFTHSNPLKLWQWTRSNPPIIKNGYTSKTFEVLKAKPNKTANKNVFV